MMFRTDDHDRVGVPGMFGQGLSQWQAVSRILRTHWYHVTVEISQDGKSSECSLMIDHDHRLEQLALAEDSEFRIISAQVVTPARLNGSQDWKMEKLVSVTLANDKRGLAVCILEVDGGAIYHDSMSDDFSLSELKEKREIYRVAHTN